MAQSADPAAARSAAVEVIHRLRDAGHHALLAGGCVRDELLGLRPTDYDVATDALPDRVRGLFPRARLVGAAFGVMQVPYRHAGHSGSTEVATFRAEGTYSDKRRPDAVAFTDAPTDARRRDFTINALFLDPVATPPSGTGTPPVCSPLGGVVIDYVSGLSDLQRGIIRAVGDPHARLAEDHLRALRAVRFAARLGFALEASTAEAIRVHARELAGVSRERIGDELRRMFASPSRARAAELLETLGLDAPALTEPPRAAPSADATFATLAALPPPARWTAALAAWAIDRTPLPSRPLLCETATLGATCSRYRRALCLSNDETDTLKATLQTWADLRTRWPAGGVAWHKRVASRAEFLDALCLLRAESPAQADAITQRLAELKYEPNPNGIPLEPIVTGDDLVLIGLCPGPGFKTLLDALLDAQLEGRLTSKEEGLELARRWGVKA
jgi:poly(A) polymerase